MKRALLALVAVPLAFALGDAAYFKAHNRNNGSIVVDGRKREYLLYVPRHYAKPAPLVISLHGAGGWPAQQRDISEWNRLAEKEGFLVVYPSGADDIGPRIWRISDTQFIAALIDKLEATYAIDPTRIYANGFSNGGEMTFVLSCMLSDRLAAVGMAGAAQLQPWSWCRNERAVPVIAFHGTDDRFAPYRGGESPVAPDDEPFPSVPEWTAHWARRNRCSAAPIATPVAADVTRVQYGSCADDAAVVLYTIRGGGHQWFGGEPLPEWFVGRMNRNIDVTAEMWAFFRAHRRHG